MHEPHDFDGAPIPVLVDFLKSPTVQERADAACALGDRLRCREISRFESDVQEGIAALLEDPVPIVQFEAAMALAEAHDERATEILIEALRFRTLRLDATRALGTLGDPHAVPHLVKLMRGWAMPWADKLQAAAALCALGDPLGAAYLKTKLLSRRRAERAAAIHFVGESRHPEAQRLVPHILQDPTHPMRDVAARALGLLGDPATKSALEAAKTGADAELLQDIDAALHLLSRPSA